MQRPKVSASQTLVQGIDVSTSALLYYADTGRHGLISSSLLYKGDKKPAASNAQDKRELLFKFDELYGGERLLS